MRDLNPNPPIMLSRAALAFHAAIASEMLQAIAYVWWCALTGHRERSLNVAAASLIGQGVLVRANGGDCPLGRSQERLGNPLPPSSWHSRHAPQNGLCPRWGPSPRLGLPYRWYAVGVRLVKPSDPTALSAGKRCLNTLFIQVPRAPVL